jgi:anti-sigma factor RsiW
MSRCEKDSTNTLLYLGGELSDSECEAFCVHLEVCDRCREQLEAEEALSDILRRSSPLYSVSEELRASVEKIAAGGCYGFCLFGI